MAYGVIMGQTPILSASGIEYDNSQTASVITGNNVQQAIDESVKKIESVESKSASWKLIYSESINKTISSSGSITNQTLLSNVLANIDYKKHPLLIMNFNGMVSLSRARYIHFDVGSAGYNLRMFTGSNKSEYSVGSYFLLGYEGDTASSDVRYYIMSGSEYINSKDCNLYFSTDGNSDTINLNLTFQIYGLKAPI